MLDLDPKYCGQCGYDLTGLPAQGRCPECGQGYDITTGLGLGAGEHKRIHITGSRLRTLLCAAAAILVLLIGSLLSLFARQPISIIAAAAVLSTICALAAVTSYLYEREG